MVYRITVLFCHGVFDVYLFILSLWDNDLICVQEQIMALFLNVRGKIIAYRLLATGGVSRCQVEIWLLVM